MRYLAEGFIEALLLILHFPISALHIVFPFKEPTAPSSGPVVIMVVRWINQNPLHNLMKRYLERHGCIVYKAYFDVHRGSFTQSARELQQFIEERDLHDVVLVGISGGGLTCYEYLQNRNGWSNTRQFIAVGTPFSGAQLSFLMVIRTAREEMSPKGEYIKSVLQKPVENKKNIYCLGAKYDEIVGSKNSFLPGTYHEIIDVAGHNVLHTIWTPTFKRIAELILR